MGRKRTTNDKNVDKEICEYQAEIDAALARLRASTETAHSQIDELGNQSKLMNENIKRARDTYIHDMEKIKKIDDRSI